MDPIFDRTNTEAAVPHLPCPHVDWELLLKMSQAVINEGFPEPNKRPVDPEFDVESLLAPLIEQSGRQSSHTSDERLLGLDVCGHGGGQWQVIVRGEAIIGVETGVHVDRKATCRLNVETFASLANGRISWREALQSGTAQLRGNGRTLDQYTDILDQLFVHTWS